MEYNFRDIEQKWRHYWAQNKTYKIEIDYSKPKYYVLDMFPYPSGAGLHVGHPLGYIASDIYSRYKRMKGFNVLHPMGYDAFGLPAEQYAIQTGQHPAVTTEENITRYREQLDKIGFSFDWSREVRTCDPNYYKWTQWAFIKMFEHWYDNNSQKAEPITKLINIFEKQGNLTVNATTNQIESFSASDWNAFTDKQKQETLLNYRLAYQAHIMVNWCPALGTVLANDEVKDGLSVRGGHAVEQKEMKQWCLRISAYAQRLLEGLDRIDWSESIKEVQRNWIGKSEGAEIDFYLSPSPSPKERGEKNSEQSSSVIERGNRPNYFTSSTPEWKKLIERAKEFRKNPTDAEDAMWQELRADKIGYKIRRQHPVGPFIPDFVCIRKNAIIEIDGGIHLNLDVADHDKAREEYLKVHNYTIIRFTNEDVLASPTDIVHKIKNLLDSLPDICKDDNAEPRRGFFPPSPLERGRGRGKITVFTTRADTIFGVTFMVLAPESTLVEQLTTIEQKQAVDAYIEDTKKRTQRERIAEVKRVSGVFSGSYAINPLTNEEIPIWISDYVLAGYGTGAIMAVPAHDSRDFAFARHFNLPITQVVVPSGEEASDTSIWSESKDSKEGTMIHSGFITGLSVPEAIQKTKEYVNEKGIGTVKINYRLRDAIFSRQRYWGEPFPVYYKDGLPTMLDESKLPLPLPAVDKYLPTEDGHPPLGRATNWHTTDGYPYELSTMPGFAGSSAYYLRYMDPKNDSALVSKDAVDYWQDVDLYLGGNEHATGHLIYSRFWNKFLFDIGLTPKDEPFKKLINQGMIQGKSNFVYRVKGTNTFASHNLHNQHDTQELHVDVNIVTNDVLDIEAFKAWRPEFADAEFILEDGKYVCGWAVEKMSKSMYNVVNPDLIVEKYGADTLRMYEMFLGPLEMSKPWDTSGIEGVHKFLRKLWNTFFTNDSFSVSITEPNAEELKILHKTIKKITSDIETFSFNTSISAFMICLNELQALKCNKRAILEPIVILIAPFAPHIAEELWHQLGHNTTVCDATFPMYEEKYLVENSVKYPVSFNGKVRFSLEIAAGTSAPEVEKIAMSDEQTAKWLEGKQPKKIIVVPGKIVNIVL